MDSVFIIAAYAAGVALMAIPHFIDPPSSRTKRLLLYAARAPGWLVIHVLPRILFVLPIYALFLGFNGHQAMNFLQEQMEKALKQRYGENAKRVIDRWKPERIRKEEARPEPPPCQAKGCEGRCQRHLRRNRLVKNSVPDWETLLSIWTFVAFPVAASFDFGWTVLVAWTALQIGGFVCAREDRALFWKTLRLWVLATHRTEKIRQDIGHLAPPSPETAQDTAAAARYRVTADATEEDAELDGLLALAEQVIRERCAENARTT